jgi:hypothetical protein
MKTIGIVGTRRKDSEEYWVSSPIGTCLVIVDKNGTILDTARLWGKFIGQPFDNLQRWLGYKGGLKVVCLTKKEGNSR